MKRITLTLSLLLLLTIPATAQMNELGVFISTTQLEDGELDDAGDLFDVEFEEDMGVGLLYNRFWTSGFSTELAYQRLGADLTISADNFSEEIGSLDLDVLSATAQLHFARGAMIDPYIGGGVAYVSGQVGSIDADELEETDLENELELLANAGITVGLGRSLALFLDGKYIMYEARGEGDSDGEAIDLNPLIISGGIKWRF
ncbi:MAG TPA: OmpW family outer membrane protein [Thermoanaerobaculia bacterium]|nr:OmpW family outer membrane protein [Thermoanaerobaculia bacterium]